MMMDFKSDGQKTPYKRGLSKDIMNAIKIVYNDNVDECLDFAQQFRKNSIRETCEEIYNVLVARIRYKVDPDGEQWIRTPARLWNDKEGDCKSYSLFVCCMLSCLGVKNKFRFVDYGAGDYTHVYVIAYDENEKEICVDAVAGATKYIAFDNELKYIKKLDMENREKTDISFLSGVGETEYGLNVKANVVLLKSYKYLFEAYANNDVDRSFYAPRVEMWNGLISLVEKYGDSVPSLQVCGYVLATYVSEETHLVQHNRWGILEKEIDDYVTNSQKAGEFVLTEKFKNANKDFLDWWNQNIIGLNYLNSSTNTPAMNDEIANVIVDTCFAYLYLVADAVKLTKKASQKKENQKELVLELVSKGTLTYEAALNFATIGILNKTKNSPDDVLLMMIGKWKNSKVSGVSGVDDVLDSSGKIIDQVRDLGSVLKDWFGKDDSSETTKVVYMPSSSDWSSSSNLLLIGGLGLVALLLLMKNNNKSGKK